MTFRGYHARLIAVTQQKLREQRDSALSVLMGIAGAFAGKDSGGFGQVSGEVEKAIGELDESLISLMGGRTNAKEKLSAIVGDSVSDQELDAAMAASRDQGRKKLREVKDIQRDIRRLDVIMSAISRSPVQNPLGGYEEAGVSPMTSYDVSRSIKDKLRNV